MLPGPKQPNEKKNLSLYIHLCPQPLLAKLQMWRREVKWSFKEQHNILHTKLKRANQCNQYEASCNPLMIQLVLYYIVHTLLDCLLLLVSDTHLIYSTSTLFYNIINREGRIIYCSKVLNQYEQTDCLFRFLKLC